MRNSIYGCCWAVTILALGYIQQGVQGSPRPDFGIDAVISGTGRVSAIADEASVGFGGFKYNVSLTTNYTRLYTLRTALTTIATRIATDGKSVGAALVTLANSTGPLPTVFNDTLTAVKALQTQLSTGLASQRATIEAAVGPAINLMLNDAGKRLQGTLTLIAQQLGSLNASINAAVVAANGTTPITPEVIRRYVTPGQMATFKHTLQEFKTDLPLYDHIFSLTLLHLKLADIYLSSYMNQAMVSVNDAILLFPTFKFNVKPSVGSVDLNVTTELYDYIYDQLEPISGSVSYFNTYPEMKAALEQFNLAYSDERIYEVSNNFTKAFDDYMQKVKTLDDYLDRFFDSQLCEPVRAVLQVLIASGPWAEYCFYKYWPKLDVLLQNAVDDMVKCYQVEEIRLERIFKIVPRLAVQLTFDFQNWAENAIACTELPSGTDECFQSIGSIYNELALLAVAKQLDYLQLTIQETTASYNRMGACFATAKYGLVLSAEKIVSAVGKCETSGPSA
uniref:Putative secreted protein n=2 Tax=Anopheles triannulatus TaxID=58253 RepID=A0A2M4AL99_9DIPT